MPTTLTLNAGPAPCSHKFRFASLSRAGGLALILASLIACQQKGDTGEQGPVGPVGPQGPMGSFAGTFPQSITVNGAVTIAQALNSPGSSPATALASCTALYQAGVQISGRYFINPSGTGPRETYCDMETNGGGWTLVYNSALGQSVTEFWRIDFAERFAQRGVPGIATNYYDGDVYKYGRTYMDVIEDLRGKVQVAMVATTTGLDPQTMRFGSPNRSFGNDDIFTNQFAGGWSSADTDLDDDPNGNCATQFAGVTQHYAHCFVYNLGADADTPVEDAQAGPHININVAGTLGLSGDGTSYPRVRRISRFAKW